MKVEICFYTLESYKLKKTAFWRKLLCRAVSLSGPYVHVNVRARGQIYDLSSYGYNVVFKYAQPAAIVIADVPEDRADAYIADFLQSVGTKLSPFSLISSVWTANPNCVKSVSCLLDCKAATPTSLFRQATRIFSMPSRNR